MAAATVGSLVGFFSSIDTDQGPLIGRLITVATNANVIELAAANGDDQGDANILTITITDAELGRCWWTVTPNLADPPGTVGLLSFAPLNPAYVYVIRSFILTPNDLGGGNFSSPFTGVGGNTPQHLIYGAICPFCGGTPQLHTGGQRIMFATDIPGVWTHVADGQGVNYFPV